MPSSPVKQWYAVYTRSNYEKLVAEQLAAKGVENFLPCFREVHRWKDRRKVVDVPLFRSYVFARFADEGKERLRVLRSAGSVRILGLGDQIEAIPGEQIEAVRTMLNSGRDCRPHPFLSAGCRVRVKRGALAGLEGIFVRAQNDATKLVIAVDLLQKSVAAEVRREDVEVLPSAVSAKPLDKLQNSALGWG